MYSTNHIIDCYKKKNDIEFYLSVQRHQNSIHKIIDFIKKIIIKLEKQANTIYIKYLFLSISPDN